MHIREIVEYSRFRDRLHIVYTINVAEQDILTALRALVDRSKPVPIPADGTLETPPPAAKPPRRRGRQRRPRKVPVSLRLDPDVVAALRAQGRGWQTRLNAVLKELIARGALAPLEDHRRDPQEHDSPDHGGDERP